LASGSDDRTARIWELSTGKILHILEGHENLIRAVVWHPTRPVVASASSDQSARLWDVNDGRLLHQLEGHDNRVTSVRFHPQGKLVATGSEDETMRLWDVDSGDCVSVLGPDRLYEGLDITGVTGLSTAQRTSLLALGAVERSSL
jgi:WD40 repeat protein